MPSTTEYSKCTFVELETFARSRGLSAFAIARGREWGPTCEQYCAALQQADNEQTFCFLQMPPELRNVIYRELLVFDPETRACYPQLLGACKQINKEASSILYSSNIIDIAVDCKGVVVHSTDCGNYITSSYPNHLQDRHTGELHWPLFLRKVQSLRLTIGCLLMPPWEHGLSVPRLRTANNIIYSLCSFLEGNHRLTSLELDLEYLSESIPQSQLYPVRSTLYPLKLLGDVKTLTLIGYQPLVVQMLEAMSPTSLTAAVLPNLIPAAIKEIKAYQDAISKLLFPRQHRTHAPLARFARYVATATFTAVGFCLGGLCFGPGWERALIGSTKMLRWVMNHPTVLNVDEKLCEEVERLLRLDIDMRLARRGIEAVVGYEIHSQNDDEKE